MRRRCVRPRSTIRRVKRHLFKLLAAVSAVLCGLAAIVALCIVGLRAVANRTFSEPDTDPAHYSGVLTEWKQTGLVKLFPAEIPHHATGIHFSATPGSLQGRPWIQLRMKLAPDQIAAIDADAQSATTHVYAPDHGFSLPGKDGDWPIPNYETGDSPQQFQFPATFKIYVISAVDRGSGSWDPHESYGVAVSRETNEVVYWADR
jgi:hypothetical protein